MRGPGPPATDRRMPPPGRRGGDAIMMAASEEAAAARAQLPGLAERARASAKPPGWNYMALHALHGHYMLVDYRRLHGYYMALHACN